MIYTWGDVTEELHHALSTKLREAVVIELENARAMRGKGLYFRNIVTLSYVNDDKCFIFKA